MRQKVYAVDENFDFCFPFSSGNFELEKLRPLSNTFLGGESAPPGYEGDSEWALLWRMSVRGREGRKGEGAEMKKGVGPSATVRYTVSPQNERVVQTRTKNGLLFLFIFPHSCLTAPSIYV